VAVFGRLLQKQERDRYNKSDSYIQKDNQNTKQKSTEYTKWKAKNSNQENKQKNNIKNISRANGK
jgi:hypothetical protein